MYEGWPILGVYHDVKNDRWQFVNGWGDTDDVENGVWVHPKHLVDLDESIAELADLPAGWRGWRETADDTWTREPQLPD